ncbi:hypothetical protein JCM10450v2_003497 [Rhodotorula kratochvilovae]
MVKDKFLHRIAKQRPKDDADIHNCNQNQDRYFPSSWASPSPSPEPLSPSSSSTPAPKPGAPPQPPPLSRSARRPLDAEPTPSPQAKDTAKPTMPPPPPPLTPPTPKKPMPSPAQSPSPTPPAPPPPAAAPPFSTSSTPTEAQQPAREPQLSTEPQPSPAPAASSHARAAAASPAADPPANGAPTPAPSTSPPSGPSSPYPRPLAPTPSPPPAASSPSPPPNPASPFFPKLRTLLEDGQLASAYRILCALTPGPAASPARRANVLALCGAGASIELALEHARCEEALEGVEVVEGLWAQADALSAEEGVKGRAAGVKLDPPFIPAYYFLAVGSYILGNLPKAFIAAMKASSEDGFVARGNHALLAQILAIVRLKKVGNEAFFARNFDLAIESYTDALEIDPEHEEVTVLLLRNRGAAYLRSGDPISALDDVSRILALRPAHALLAFEDAVRCAAPGSQAHGNAQEGKVKVEATLREKEERAREREEEAARQAKQARQEAEETKARQEAGTSGATGASYGAASMGEAPNAADNEEEEEEQVVTDHYELLGLHRAASTAEIRTAYLRLSRIAHPDKGGSHTLFVRIKTAYDVLVDPLRRRTYDSAQA